MPESAAEAEGEPGQGPQQEGTPDPRPRLPCNLAPTHKDVHKQPT